VRVLLSLTLAVVVTLAVLPRGCQRVREHLLLTLLHESERAVELASLEPLAFRFPSTAVRAAALIDLHSAASPSEHVSFLPPAGSDRYAWAVGVCPTWSAACLDSHPAATLSTLTYGQLPAGLVQIEPARGPPAALVDGRLYGLALFGEKLFALKVFYRDAGGVHFMDGWRFAESVTRGERTAVHRFLGSS
jgi:hypothetical protein